MMRRFLNVKNIEFNNNNFQNSLYQCHQCYKFYAHKGNLVRHIKFECGVQRQFKCSDCQYMSKRKDQLVRHLMMVHGIYTLT